MNSTHMRTLSNHNDITAFRKRHINIFLQNFKVQKNQHQQSDQHEMRNFYRPLYKEAVL